MSAQPLEAAGVTPGGALTVDGLTFHWPQVAPGSPDNLVAAGQVVQLPAQPGATRLALLGLATCGPSAGEGVVRYADGSAEPFTLCLPDWTLNGGRASAVPARVAVRMPRRNARNGDLANLETIVFAAAIPLQPGRTAATVTLSARVDQGALHIFALALGAGAGDPPD